MQDCGMYSKTLYTEYRPGAKPKIFFIDSHFIFHRIVSALRQSEWRNDMSYILGWKYLNVHI